MQVKLLRAIQEKTIRAIGDTKEVPVDIRILSATHKNLNQLVETGSFRQDLYYRINFIELTLPALNARRDDITALAKHFLALIAEEWQLESAPELTANAYKRLQQHAFAGNVRELRNVLERARTLSKTSVIDAEHLGLPVLSSDGDLNNILEVATVNQRQHSALDDHQTDNSDSSQDDTTNHNIDTSTANTNIQKTPKQSNPNLHPYRTVNHPYSSTIKTANASKNSAEKKARNS